MHTTLKRGRPFSHRAEALRSTHLELWRSTDDSPPELERMYSRREQRENERRAERSADGLEREMGGCPSEPEARRTWREALRSRIGETDLSFLGIPAEHRRILTSDEHFESTCVFVRKARAFAPWIDALDVFQALRNVWIANSLQALLDVPVETTPALFGYSMLYPWTDNFLDDASVSGPDKVRFCEHFGRRLAGEELRPRDRREQEVFELVALVEEQFPRALFPDVHDSLLEIHEAQVASLAQEEDMTSGAVLELSFRKGGSSVLADGYVVAGGLADLDAEFCFGYGIFLQLLDDLQDIDVDRLAGHRTIFSEAIGLDRLFSRLHAFTGRVLDRQPRFLAKPELADLIRRNSVLLSVVSVANHAERFPAAFARHLEARSPVGFSWLREQRSRSEQRRARLGRKLRRGRLRSVLEILD